MNRKQILLKHLGIIHISDATMKAVLEAMEESEGNYYLEFSPIDWKLLIKQKESLVNVISYFRQNPEKNKIIINNLSGILHLIDNLQDNNCEE